MSHTTTMSNLNNVFQRYIKVFQPKGEKWYIDLYPGLGYRIESASGNTFPIDNHGRFTRTELWLMMTTALDAVERSNATEALLHLTQWAVGNGTVSRYKQTNPYGIAEISEAVAVVGIDNPTLKKLNRKLECKGLNEEV